MSEVPIIKPVKSKEYTTKQSRYSMVGKLPTRSLVVGPSGSGKGILLSNMILDIYRDCFSRIYIFSPSINVDHTWEVVKYCISKHMKVRHTDEEPIYLSGPNFEALENMVETQHQIIKYMKSQGHTKLYEILIIINDLADDEQLVEDLNY